MATRGRAVKKTYEGCLEAYLTSKKGYSQKWLNIEGRPIFLQKNSILDI